MYTEANTCLYMVKWVYTRRQTLLHEKANVFALYLASDLYCTCTCTCIAHTCSYCTVKSWKYMYVATKYTILLQGCQSNSVIPGYPDRGWQVGCIHGYPWMDQGCQRTLSSTDCRMYGVWLSVDGRGMSKVHSFIT